MTSIQMLTMKTARGRRHQLGRHRWCAAGLLALAAIGCGGSAGGGTGAAGSTPSAAETGATYTIGGSLSGLATGRQVTLQNNGAEVLVLSGDGAFSFGTAVPVNGAYRVTVLGQPQGQACTVTGATGSVSAANIANVSVACTTVMTVSTLAGSGALGYADGSGQAAAFSNPYGLAVDGAGNVFVADALNHRIRKITPQGVVSTLAGSGSPGFADGTGAAASFRNPIGLAIDSAGNLYVADTFNQRIRKVTSAGAVSTLAGSGFTGFADGTGAAASFLNPFGVACDNAGNIYVADAGNNRIRLITAGGIVSTLAGSGTYASADGTGAAASFTAPSGVATASDGTVYVAEGAGNRIRKIAPGGVVSTLAGSGTLGYADGSGTAAMFSDPFSLATDTAGNIYVADTANYRIRKITSGGLVSTVAGNGVAGYADGPGLSSSFNAPYGIAIDSAGRVYVGDTYGNRIRRLD